VLLLLQVLSKLLPTAATGRWHEASQLLVLLHAAVGGDGMCGSRTPRIVTDFVC